MTPKEREALQVVIGQHPVTAISIAAQIGVCKTAASKYMLNLQRAGLVTKETIRHNYVLYRPTGDAKPQPKMREYEQAASVWQYAERCKR